MRCGLPGPSGPDPGTGVDVKVYSLYFGKQSSSLNPQIQQLAPHLRVVSKREIGKKLPYPAESAGWQLSVYLRAEPLSVSGTH
jgi:hypothetical protein